MRRGFRDYGRVGRAAWSSWTPGWGGGVAGPAGAAHVDADGGAGGAERGAFGQVVLEGHAVVPGGGGAVGVDHPPPCHRAAVGGHDAADLAGPEADAQVLGDVAVGHHPPGRDRVHHVEHAAGEVADRRRAGVIPGPRHRLARGSERRSTASRVPAAAISTSEVSASIENKTSRPEPRGWTGAADCTPWYLTVALMLVAAGRTPASRPALVRAAAASTMPNPTWLSYPSAGRSLVVEVSARATRSGVSRGYFDLIRAATPATSAQAGLVPLTSQYCPSRPWAGTDTPGAATLTDRFSLEKGATSPLALTALTLITPG